jgi:hypothetical protein
LIRLRLSREQDSLTIAAFKTTDRNKYHFVPFIRIVLVMPKSDSMEYVPIRFSSIRSGDSKSMTYAHIRGSSSS